MCISSSFAKFFKTINSLTKLLQCYHSQDKFGSSGEAEYPGNSCELYAVERSAAMQSMSGGYRKRQTRNLP